MSDNKTIDLERICREAGARFDTVGEESGMYCGWVFPTNNNDRCPSLSRLCNAVLEEAEKAVEVVHVMFEDEPTGRGYLDDAVKAIRALRVPEKD